MRSQAPRSSGTANRSEEHTSELQSRPHLVCRLLLEKTLWQPFALNRAGGLAETSGKGNGKSERPGGRPPRMGNATAGGQEIQVFRRLNGWRAAPDQGGNIAAKPF